jgi:hypothetical protein
MGKSIEEKEAELLKKLEDLKKKQKDLKAQKKKAAEAEVNKLLVDLKAAIKEKFGDLNEETIKQAIEKIKA